MRIVWERIPKSERPDAQPSVNWGSVLRNETETEPTLWMHFDRRPEFSLSINTNSNFWPTNSFNRKIWNGRREKVYRLFPLGVALFIEGVRVRLDEFCDW